MGQRPTVPLSNLHLAVRPVADMIPRNVKTRAVAAKNASGRVLYVRQRVVSELLHDFRLIFAGFITVKPRCNAPVAARGCGELRRIIPKHRRRACARQRRLFSVRFGCVQLRADAQQLVSASMRASTRSAFDPKALDLDFFFTPSSPSTMDSEVSHA